MNRGEGSDTSQLDEKIIGVEAGLSALNRRVVIVENNFISLDSVDLVGLDDVKNNLVELEEVHKEGCPTSNSSSPRRSPPFRESLRH